jgi:septal ring factor EnvC (AmiA/AmiB activator)
MQAELDEREAGLDLRETDVVSQELKVRQALVDVERLGAELRDERERLSADEKRYRLELAEQRRRWELEAAEKRRELERHGEQLDFRRAAVKQEQDDLADAQREMLEMRLAVEELWTQLSGLVPPAVLTENLARLRNRLSEQYRLQQTELTAQKAELESLRADLAAESEKLRHKTDELRRWADLRNEEIERQAAFLTAREQELETQDADLHRQSQAWRQERGRLEQEIRRLENDLRRAGLEAPSLLRR